MKKIRPPAKPTREEFFVRYLERSPIALAFWRSFECHSFSREELKAPVLDVGCGDGFFARTVFGGGLAAGIDLDPGEVALALQSGSYRKTLLGDATHIPFPDKSFRTVISNCVLEHVPDIDLALKEIRRVLRPGGRLLITVPSEHFNRPFFRRVLERIGLGGLGKAYLDGLNKVFKHFHVDDASTWGKRLRRAGLRVEKVDGIIPLDSFRTYEFWMLLAFPSKILKLLTGRWVVGPRGPVKSLASRFLKESLRDGSGPGACYFISARKA